MKRPHSSVFRFAALLLALSVTALIGTSTWAKASTIATESNTSHSENNTFALPATAQNSASAGSAIPQEPASNDTLLRVQVGDQVPSFTVEMFDGSQVCIDSLRGKVVWINFGQPGVLPAGPSSSRCNNVLSTVSRRRVCFPAHLSWGDQRDRCGIS